MDRHRLSEREKRLPAEFPLPDMRKIEKENISGRFKIGIGEWKILKGGGFVSG